jgi:hypothetical protein
MNDPQTPVKNRQTRYDLNFKRSAVELWQSSGHQTWAQRVPSQRAQADAQLLPLLRQGHAEGRGNYGRPACARVAGATRHPLRPHARMAVVAPCWVESKTAA